MHPSWPKYLSRLNSLLHSAGSLPYYFQKCCHLLSDPVFKRREEKKKKKLWWQVGGRERVLLCARAEVMYCHFLPGRRKAGISHSLGFSHGNHPGALWTHLLFAPVQESVGLWMHLPFRLLCVSSQAEPCVVATKTELHAIACSGIGTAANTSQKTLYLVTSQPVF